MVLDQILLAMDLLTLLFALVTLVYLKRNREYERLELESGLNALLFGMFSFSFRLLSLLPCILEKHSQLHLNCSFPRYRLT